MQSQEVLQQKLEHWCATTARALANDSSIHFRGHQLVVNEQPFVLQAPYLQLDFSTKDNAKLRGISDSIALRLMFSDLAKHEHRMPENIVEKIIYEQLEQFRCESLSPESLPGIRSNLRSRFLYWASQAASSPLVDNSIGLLLYTIQVVCWSRIQAHAIPEQIEEAIEATRWGFSDEIKHHLYRINRGRDDQDQFAVHALAIAKEVQTMIETSQTAQDGNSKDTTSIRQLEKHINFNIQWLEVDSVGNEENLAKASSGAIAPVSQIYQYRIYNTRYDKVVEIAKTVRPAQLLKLRAQLDKRVRQQSINTHRIARYLRQIISSPNLAGWEFGLEEGFLDSARLSRLVTSPDDRRLFKHEKIENTSDCIVSLLIDNSGSMNHHNDVIAAMVDTLAKALELAGISSEILGFTTVEWNGGKVAKEWIKNGKPANPGRLTSTCHNIYKAAETPWRRARPAIAAMLKTDLFREGIDGEALQWAMERIETRREKNKIIMVISDGSPMDTATHAANNDRYLDQHLSLVAKSIELRHDIRLCALGVGLDLSAYFRQSMSISLDNELSTPDFMQIADLLAQAY